MLLLPADVIREGIIPLLSIHELQSLDIACTNTTSLPHWRNALKNYRFTSNDVIYERMFISELMWLHSVGVIVECIDVFDSVTSDLLMFIAQNISAVKKFVGKINDTQIYNSIPMFAHNCPNIEDLCLVNNVRYMSPQICEICDESVLAIATHCTNLHTINLAGWKISDAAIKALCANCPNLLHICLNRCTYLSDTSLVMIASTYPHLRRIDISECNFSYSAHTYFARQCQALQYARSDCPWKIVDIINFWKQSLTTIDLTQYRTLLDDDDICGLVKSCQLLKSLKLRFCRNITDIAVIAVAEHCPQLRLIDISRCEKLSDNSLIALGEHCHELRSINISCLNAITAKGVSQLCMGCPLLHSFTAYRTKIIGESPESCFIMRFCEQLPLLSQLYLHASNIDDSRAVHLAQCCRNLTVLDISGSPICYAATIREIFTRCAQMRFFIFRKCRLLDKTSLLSLHEEYPHIKIVVT